MKKVCVVITARASYARVKSVLRAIQKSEKLELFIIGSASLLLYKYGNAIEALKNDGFQINEKVYMSVEGDNPATMAKTVGIGIMELATIFDNQKPDIVVSIADRFETICTAIAASYLNIPVAHVQGGEITGSIDEKVRHAVTKFSSLHFAATEKAAERIKWMGEHDETVFVTGCPSIDLADEILRDHSFMTSEYLYSKYGGIGDPVSIENDFLVVMQHPVTTEFENAYEQMLETLLAIQESKLAAIIFWPNADAGSEAVSKAIREYREKYHPKNTHFFRNLMPEDFLALLIKSRGIVGNSSVAIRECSFLGVPAVNIGTRQIGRERGSNVLDVSPKREEILSAISNHLLGKQSFPSERIYGDGSAGEKITQILESANPEIEKRFVDVADFSWLSSKSV